MFMYIYIYIYCREREFEPGVAFVLTAHNEKKIPAVPVHKNMPADDA